ncbi:MAG: cobalamin-dependent protein [Pseudomonadota bacterium]
MMWLQTVCGLAGLGQRKTFELLTPDRKPQAAPMAAVEIVLKTGGHVTYSNDASGVLDHHIYLKRQSTFYRRAKTLPEDKLESLAREALRRLVSKEVTAGGVGTKPTTAELERLCDALIAPDDTAAADIISEVEKADVAPEFVYLNYLAASARMLGDWWEQDRATFMQVTLGTGRLLAIMRGMSHLFERPFSASQKSAVFAAVPGEQHIVGLQMAADIFRQDGWHVTSLFGLEHDPLVSDIEQTGADAIGLSMSGAHSLDALVRLVVALHICCPNTPILLSGQGVDALAPKLKWLELDAISGDLNEAKARLNALVTHAKPKTS